MACHTRIFINDALAWLNGLFTSCLCARVIAGPRDWVRNDRHSSSRSPVCHINCTLSKHARRAVHELIVSKKLVRRNNEIKIVSKSALERDPIQEKQRAPRPQSALGELLFAKLFSPSANASHGISSSYDFMLLHAVVSQHVI